MMLWNTDLDLAERCAARRQYRILRIALYAPQCSEYSRTGMFQGAYGMTRDDAKKRIMDYYLDVSWYTYLGSK
jgi:hypothetical protein